MTSVLITTVPGLEDIVIKELILKLGVDNVSYRVVGSSRSGRLLVEIPRGDVRLRDLRTVEKMYLVLESGSIGRTLNDLIAVVKRVNYSALERYLTPSTTFAVRCTRVGDHDYKSTQVVSLVGDEIIRHFVRSRGFRPIVNLDSPDLVVEFDVIESEYFFGIELTRRTLRSRDYRVFKHEAAINPIIACAMNYLLEDVGCETICDPLCGSGTIPIEGCFVHRKARYLCIDIDYRNVRGSVLNAKRAGSYSKIDFIAADSTMLSNFIRYGSVRHFVTNPPYGIRVEPLEGLSKLYSKIVREVSRMLDEDGRGKFVLITIRRGLVRRLAQRYGLRISHERMVFQGGLMSSIFVLKRARF